MATITDAKKRIDLLKKCTSKASITPVYLGEVLDAMADATTDEIRTVSNVAQLAYTDIDLVASPDDATFTASYGGNQTRDFVLSSATTSVAGLLSAADKNVLDDMADRVPHLIKSVSVQEGYGAHFLLVDTGSSDYELKIPLATRFVGGFMPAADKAKLDDVNPDYLLTNKQHQWVANKSEETDVSTYTATFERRMALRKDQLLVLANPNLDNAVKAVCTHFRISVVHSSFCGTLNFSVYLSEGRYIIDVGAATGNISFVKQIVIANVGNVKALIIVPSENLTAATNLPIIRLEMVGRGWDIDPNAPYYHESSTGTIFTQVAPTFAKFANLSTTATTSANGLMAAADKTKLDDVVGKMQALHTFNPVANLYPDQVYPDEVSIEGEFLNGDLCTVVLTAATQEFAGIMSAADKRKLDAVAGTLEHLIAHFETLATRVEKLEQNPFGQGA